jgi:maleylacetate reductase
MTRFTYQALPGRVLFGSGIRGELSAEIERLGCSRALILSTSGHEAEAKELARQIGKLAVEVFAGAVMHTPVAVSEQAAEIARSVKADCIVAFGGGSTIGLSKAIALRTDLPQLVIPTTYSGSEMTPIIGETEAGHKTTKRTLKVLPETVLYDPELTLSLPVKVSIVSGINGMAHAVEALYAKDRNPAISLLAEESIRGFRRGLPMIMETPNDKSARSDTLYAAWLAGTCLGAVGMSLHHKLCHVLGGAFNLPHAETHTVVLPHAVAYNSPAEPDVMDRIAKAIDADEAATGLFDFAGRLKTRRSLRELGMPESGIEKAAALAVQDPYWNPRELERQSIEQLIRRAWAGAPPSCDG